MAQKLFPHRALKIISILVAFLLILPAISSAGQFTVTRVYDGDTVKAIGHDIESRVRLVGIDTPETSKKKRDPGQPYRQHAKKYLDRLVLDKVLNVRGYGLDRYNRILGVIYFNRKNINLEIVRERLAEVYRGKPPRSLDIGPYRQAEAEDKKAGRSMWTLGDKYISPKGWREMHRGK